MLAATVFAGCAQDAAARRSRVTLLGILRVGPDATAELVECGTGKTIEMTLMPLHRYRRLHRHYRRLSARGRQPVTARVSGHLDRSRHGGVLRDAVVLGLVPGECRMPRESAADYD